MLPYTYTQLRAALGVALALIVLVVVSISSAAPAAAQFSEIPVASVLNPDGTINTTTGVSGALDMHGWNVTLDSKRGPVLAPQGAPAVAPNAGWSAFANNGLNGTVNALAIMGSDLYVGGYFNATADGAVTNLKYIAKYSNNTWSPLAHNGLNNPVYALAVIGSDLYVGGDFIRTADSAVTNLNRIAKYSAGAWWPLANNGLKGPVHAFAVSGSDLYVGGYFTTTADDAVTNLNNIAKYTSNNTWSPLANNGLNAYVYTLALMGSDLYVGGWFDQTADGEVTNLNNIAKYSNNTWSPLANNGLNETVFALAVSGTDLYVGGEFTATADSAVTNLNAIAKYSNDEWSPLADNGLARIGSSYWVDALMILGSDLYVGGAFTQTADGTMALNRIAKYNNDTWSPLANNGLVIAGGGVCMRLQCQAVTCMSAACLPKPPTAP